MRMKAAIFDVDGTLLDSMPIWMEAGAQYLRSISIEPEPELSACLWNMSIPEGVQYLKEQYRLSFSVEEITEGILSMVRDSYYYEIPLKPGVKEFLQKLREAGIPMVIATAGDRSYLEPALVRTGIAEYFEKIFTCAEVGAGKTKPVIYQAAASWLRTKPEETLVFEDVLHAVQAAKSAGFPVAAIADAASEKDAAELQKQSDCYWKDFTEGIADAGPFSVTALQ